MEQYEKLENMIASQPWGLINNNFLQNSQSINPLIRILDRLKKKKQRKISQNSLVKVTINNFQKFGCLASYKTR